MMGRTLEFAMARVRFPPPDLSRLQHNIPKPQGRTAQNHSSVEPVTCPRCRHPRASTRFGGSAAGLERLNLPLCPAQSATFAGVCSNNACGPRYGHSRTRRWGTVAMYADGT